jgi:hypothetical protein
MANNTDIDALTGFLYKDGLDLYIYDGTSYPGYSTGDIATRSLYIDGWIDSLKKGTDYIINNKQLLLNPASDKIKQIKKIVASNIRLKTLNLTPASISEGILNNCAVDDLIVDLKDNSNLPGASAASLALSGIMPLTPGSAGINITLKGSPLLELSISADTIISNLQVESENILSEALYITLPFESISNLPQNQIDDLADKLTRTRDDIRTPSALTDNLLNVISNQNIKAKAIAKKSSANASSGSGSGSGGGGTSIGLSDYLALVSNQ